MTLTPGRGPPHTSTAHVNRYELNYTGENLGPLAIRHLSQSVLKEKRKRYYTGQVLVGYCKNLVVT